MVELETPDVLFTTVDAWMLSEACGQLGLELSPERCAAKVELRPRELTLAGFGVEEFLSFPLAWDPSQICCGVVAIPQVC